MKNREEDCTESKTDYITPQSKIDDIYIKYPKIFVDNFTQNKRKRDRKKELDSIRQIIIRDFLNVLIQILNKLLSGHEIKNLGGNEKKKYFQIDKIKEIFNMTIKEFIKIYYGDINHKLSEELLNKEIKQIYLNSYLDSDENNLKLIFPNPFREKIEKIREKRKHKEDYEEDYEKDYIDKIKLVAKNLTNYCNEHNKKKKKKQK